MNTEIIGGYKMIEGMDWESFTKKLSKSEDFGKTMLKAFECQHLIDSFRKIETGVKRMSAIYDYVKNYMRWNGEYRIFASKSLEKTFEKRSGYSSDINMLLINLLSQSGIPARPVLISTRSYGDVYKEVGFFRKFNHLLVSVMIEGKRYLLDATQPERPFNWLSLEDLNGEGLLVNIMEYEWVPLINHQISTTTANETYSFTDGKINLYVVVSENGYNAFEKSAQKKLNHLDINTFLAKDFKLNSISEEKFNSFNNAASWAIEISGEKTLETHTDQISVSLQPVFNVWDVELQEEERVHPVDFGFDQVIEREVTIPVPAGFKLSEIPAEETLEMQNNMLVFQESRNW
ncbi:MAG: transglutaminase family protein [Bacteroidetes bacterium]|nr:transglutaminase family protein [Bacteroidota bacterium]